MGKIDENILNIEKKMSAEQRLIESLRLYFLARDLKAVSLKQFQPSLNKEELDSKVKEFFLYGNS